MFAAINDQFIFEVKIFIVYRFRSIEQLWIKMNKRRNYKNNPYLLIIKFHNKDNRLKFLRKIWKLVNLRMKYKLNSNLNNLNSL